MTYDELLARLDGLVNVWLQSRCCKIAETVCVNSDYIESCTGEVGILD